VRRAYRAGATTATSYASRSWTDVACVTRHQLGPAGRPGIVTCDCDEEPWPLASYCTYGTWPAPRPPAVQPGCLLWLPSARSFPYPFSWIFKPKGCLHFLHTQSFGAFYLTCSRKRYSMCIGRFLFFYIFKKTTENIFSWITECAFRTF